MLVQTVFALLFIYVPYPTVCSHTHTAALPDLTEWLNTNGATVHPGMTVGLFEHEGAEIRGVFDSEDLASNATLLAIPRKLLMELSHFPTFSEADLPSTSTCQKATGTVESVQAMRFAAAIAWEASKGKTSLYYPWFKQFPSLEDFYSFLPVLMQESVYEDYAPLPTMVKVAEMQDGFHLCRKCFEEWKVVKGSPVRQLSWNEVLHGMILLNTRSFGLDGGRTLALVPLADMLNTVANSELNVQWEDTSDTFTLRAHGPVASGAELYEGYCDGCSNTVLMNGWGIYLEGNPNRSPHGGQFCLGDEGAHLRSVTEAALQPEGSASENWLSPRCKANVLDLPQGPLRCSLARLSWETCAAEWSTESAHARSSLSFGQAHQEIAKHAPTGAAREFSVANLRGHR